MQKNTNFSGINKIEGDTFNQLEPFLNIIKELKSQEDVILQKLKKSKFNAGRLQIIINNDYCQILNISKNEQIYLLFRHLYLYLNDKSTQKQVQGINTKIKALQEKIKDMVIHIFNLSLKEQDINQILLILFS